MELKRSIFFQELLGEELWEWAYTERDRLHKHYKEIKIPKKFGGVRKISAPDDKLKEIQRIIYDKILSGVTPHPCCHGFTKNRSTVTNARFHTGKRMVVNIDLKDFFPSISSERVLDTLRSIGTSTKPDHIELEFLTRLTTYRGCLPQGASTSPALANLACHCLDKRLAGMAKKLEAFYTRYADDMTFSGNKNIIGAIPVIRGIIRDEKFEIAEKKVRILRRGNRQEVTGLAVNEKVAVPRKIRKLIRAVKYQYSKNKKKAKWKGEKVSKKVLDGLDGWVKSTKRLSAK